MLVTSDRETILPSDPTITSVPIGKRLDNVLTEITPLTETLARPSESYPTILPIFWLGFDEASSENTFTGFIMVRSVLLSVIELRFHLELQI